MFYVDETPYCVWETDIKEKNIAFLDQIDVGFFEYIANTFYPSLEEEDKKRAGLVLRTQYFHGMETLFSLLSATLQAPTCVVGWMQKYHISQVRKIIKNFNTYSHIENIQLKLNKMSWGEISDLIHRHSNSDPKRAQNTGELFSEFWNRLAHE